MALGALLTWEVRTSGSDNNGGAFNTGASGTDYSQQNSAQVAIDNSIITTSITTNVVTFVTGYTPSAADVGNVVNFLTGTNVTATVRVISSINVGAKTWTMDANVVTSGTTTNATANMGGALASPGAFGLYHIAGHDCWIAGGAYTVTSATANMAAGCLTLAGGAATNGQRVEGYASSRGDKGAYPIVKADGVITTFTLITTASATVVENIEIDGNSRASSRGINQGATTSFVIRVRGKNFTNNAFLSSNAVNEVLWCEATTCSTQAAFQVTNASYCTAYSNTITGFIPSGGAFFYRCLSINNTGGSSHGFDPGSVCKIRECVAYGNGGRGINTASGTWTLTLINTICVSNAGNGFGGAIANDNIYMFSCAYYNNGTNVSANITAANNIGGILLTGDPFTNAAGNDFSLNNTAGAGAACRAAGIPTSSGTYSLPGVSTPSYPDIGSSQHRDPAVGGIAKMAGVGGGFVG